MPHTHTDKQKHQLASVGLAQACPNKVY